jgi:hypothetical protein
MLSFRRFKGNALLFSTRTAFLKSLRIHPSLPHPLPVSDFCVFCHILSNLNVESGEHIVILKNRGKRIFIQIWKFERAG